MAWGQQHRRLVLLLLLLCLTAGLVWEASAAAAAAADSCGPRFSFFPRGGEDRNIPSSWGKTAQMAAGNFRDDQVYSVVLTSNNNLPGIAAGAVPVLHVQPIHPLLVVGSSGLHPSCTGFVSKPMQQPAAAAVTIQDSQPAATPRTAAADRLARRRPAEPDTATDEQSVLPVGAPDEKQTSQAAASAAPATAPAATAPASRPVAAGPAGPVPAPTAGAKQAASGESLEPTTRHLLSASGSSSSSALVAQSAALQAAGVFGLDGSSTGVEGEVSPSSAGRRLLDGEVVTSPARYRLAYWLNDTTPYEAGEFTMYTPVQRIMLQGLNTYPDGFYCLHVKLTIVANSGVMAGYINVPPTDLVSTTQVCFYKLDGRPSAKVEVSTCRETLGLTIKGMTPQPVPLFPGSDKSLFSAVFHFYANLNRTKDWSWPSDAVPKSLSQWVVLNAGDVASRPFVWQPEDRVAEGWYNIRLEASISTDYPSLMALGVSVVGKYEDPTTPAQLQDKPKLLATHQYQNGTVKGIQHVPTEFRSVTGPEDEVRYAVNDEMQLNWEFEGFGEQFCFIDGKLWHNSGEFNCRPPLNLQLPDRRNHSLRIILQDVCNATYVVDTVYGLWGHKVVHAPPPRIKQADSLSQFLDGGLKSFEMGSPASSTLRAPRANSARAASNAAGAAARASAGGSWLLAGALSVWWLLRIGSGWH